MRVSLSHGSKEKIKLFGRWDHSEGRLKPGSTYDPVDWKVGWWTKPNTQHGSVSQLQWTRWDRKTQLWLILKKKQTGNEFFKPIINNPYNVVHKASCKVRDWCGCIVAQNAMPQHNQQENHSHQVKKNFHVKVKFYKELHILLPDSKPKAKSRFLNPLCHIIQCTFFRTSSSWSH